MIDVVIHRCTAVRALEPTNVAKEDQHDIANSTPACLFGLEGEEADSVSAKMVLNCGGCRKIQAPFEDQIK